MLDDVWKKVGVYKKFSRSYIFGIIHKITQILLQFEVIICKPNEWNNLEKLIKVFDQHITKSHKLSNTMVK